MGRKRKEMGCTKTEGILRAVGRKLINQSCRDITLISRGARAKLKDKWEELEREDSLYLGGEALESNSYGRRAQMRFHITVDASNQ